MNSFTNNIISSIFYIFLLSTLSFGLLMFALSLCCCKEKKPKASASKSMRTPRTKSGRSESASSYPSRSKGRHASAPKKRRQPAYLDVPKNFPAVDKIFPFAEDAGAAAEPPAGDIPTPPAQTKEYSRGVGYSFHTTVRSVNETAAVKPTSSKAEARNATRRVPSADNSEKSLKNTTLRNRRSSPSSYLNKKASVMMITLRPLDSKDGQKSVASDMPFSTPTALPSLKRPKQKVHYLELPMEDRPSMSKRQEIGQLPDTPARKKQRKIKQSTGYFDQISPRSPTDTGDDSQAEQQQQQQDDPNSNFGLRNVSNRKTASAPKNVSDSSSMKNLYCGENKDDVMMITMRPLDNRDTKSISKKARDGKGGQG